MPKRLIRRITPDHDTIRNHRHLQIFGKLLHDPSLWHLNRRSASGAFAIGLFMAFVPVPFQMVLAAAAAIPFRVNLPLSVALVWITNPITMPPIFYFAYRIGTWILGIPARSHHIELSWEWLSTGLSGIWQPLFLGSFICGTVASILGYVCIRGLWRLLVIRHIKQRRERGRHPPTESS